MCATGKIMILLLTILIPILILTVYLFLSSSPMHVPKKDRTAYNLKIIIFGIITCVAVSLLSYCTTGQSVDSAWWPVGAFFGSLIVFPIILITGGIYRNFFLFRNGQQKNT